MWIIKIEHRRDNQAPLRAAIGFTDEFVAEDEAMMLLLLGEQIRTIKARASDTPPTCSDQDLVSGSIPPPSNCAR